MNQPESQLADYLVDELTLDQKSEVEQRLAEDPELRAELNELKQVKGQLQAALAAENYSFSPGEMASLRQSTGLAPVQTGGSVATFPAKLVRGSFWIGAAAACLVAIFWLSRRDPHANSLVSGEDPMGSKVAAVGSVEFIAPLNFASDPGAGESMPKLQGQPEFRTEWAEEEVAPLHSPELTRINRRLSLSLGMALGHGSFQALENHLLAQSALPPLGMIRLDELGNQFSAEMSEFSGLQRFSHPWREGDQMLLVALKPSQQDAELILDGKGTARLFGEQTAVQAGASYHPTQLEEAKKSELRLWWIEGDLDQVEVSLDGGVSTFRSSSDAEVTPWAEAPAAVRSTWLALGLGEYLRGSSSAPSEGALLSICESLRSEGLALSTDHRKAVLMTEKAIQLKH